LIRIKTSVKTKVWSLKFVLYSTIDISQVVAGGDDKALVQVRLKL